MWWNVISNINRLLSKSATELCDICNRDCIQRPESVFVESFDTLGETNLKTVCE